MLQTKRPSTLSCPFSFKAVIAMPRRPLPPKQEPPPKTFTIREKGKRPASLNLTAALPRQELKRDEPDTPPPPYISGGQTQARPPKRRVLKIDSRPPAIIQPKPAPPPPAPSLLPPEVVGIYLKPAPQPHYNAIGLYCEPPHFKNLPKIPKGHYWAGPYYHCVDVSRTAYGQQKAAAAKLSEVADAQGLSEGVQMHALGVARRTRTPRAIEKPLPTIQEVSESEAPVAAEAAPPPALAPAPMRVSAGMAARIGAWVLGLALLQTATLQIAGYYALWLGACEFMAWASSEDSAAAAASPSCSAS